MSYVFGFLFNNNNNKNSWISMIFSDMIIFLFLLFLAPTTISMAELETGQLFEFYSRDELARIAGYGEEKISTVLVTGSVHCETCLREFHSHAWPVSGALVGVNCRMNDQKTRKRRWIKGVTDENGSFTIDLPSDLHAIASLDTKCSVKVLRLPKNSLCKPASVMKHKRLRLSSVDNGIRTYSSGPVRFQHLAATSAQRCGRKDTKISMMLS